jgi:hypothetical protein
MSEYKIYYLILDVTNNRLIGGDYSRELAKTKAQKICVNGEIFFIIELTNNINDLKVWSSIYPVYHTV